MSQKIQTLLHDVAGGRVSAETAYRTLRHLPYEDIGFAKVDNHRQMRRGFPEVIFGAGKTIPQIIKIAECIIAHDGILLITRATPAVYSRLKKVYPKAVFEKKARIIYYTRHRPAAKQGTVVVMTAGTADIPVAEEARVTLELMGNTVETLYDVGVAGIHRLLDTKAVLDKASVIIVIAGMEGALASVVSGLTSKPVIAVPTSVGYGASFGGLSALLTMMNSCSPGITVVNIDNGFGAAYFASLINN